MLAVEVMDRLGLVHVRPGLTLAREGFSTVVFYLAIVPVVIVIGHQTSSGGEWMVCVLMFAVIEALERVSKKNNAVTVDVSTRLA